MKYILIPLLFLSTLSIYAKDIKLRMNLDEAFTIKENPDWNIKTDRYLTLRFADIRIFSNRGYDFDLKLYFKCDTKDLAHFNTPEKIKKSLIESSKPYLSGCLEDKVIVKKLKVKRFGFYTLLTDKDLIHKKVIPRGEYKYMTRGFFRVGNDSALGFSLMTNDIDSKEYKKMIAYILNFEI